MTNVKAILVIVIATLFALTTADCGSGNSSQAALAPVTQPTQPPADTPSPPPQQETFTVLHDFNCNGQDGTGPGAGMAMDQAGNLYGTTEGGGANALGTVFKLTNTGAGWDYAVLHSFQGSPGGETPEASIGVAPDGSLYGTTAGGGNTNCMPYCGTVFNLTRPLWTETSIYRFSPGGGTWPRSDLVFDQAGNIYGTTFSGGNVCGVRGCGVVYELTRSGGGWTENVLHKFSLTFNGNGDGVGPVGDVVFDQAGNLYGATGAGGAGCGSLGCGTIYQLTPSPGGGWTENVLYRFQNGSDGVEPRGGLIIDQSGNLYGTTSGAGAGGGGTVFELSSSSASWMFTVLYSLPGQGNGPMGSLVMDPAGNLYGMSYGNGANGAGSVFKLTPSGSGWSYTLLHDFIGGSDGKNPTGNLTLHTNGKLYGTTNSGGACGAGVVFEISP